MAQPAETLDRYDLATGGDTVREDFANTISDISPTQTPVLSMIGNGGCSNNYFTWQDDKLAAPDGSNAAIDGDDFVANALTTPLRKGNFTQITRKGVVVSGRADAVKKAGYAQELGRQVARKGLEMKRDIETIITGNQGALAGNSTTAGLTASMCAWYTTIDLRGSGGAAAPLSNSTNGFPNAAATDGTVRALTETLLLDAKQRAWVEGGEPNDVIVSGAMKRKISNYLYSTSARVATQYQDQGRELKAGKVVGSVDYWMTDFGTMRIIADRFSRDRDVHLIDAEYWSVDDLRGYRISPMGKTGDNEKRLMLRDWGLCCKNEAASAIVADIDHTAAMAA